MEVVILPQVERWFAKLAKKNKQAYMKLSALVMLLEQRNHELGMPVVRWDLQPGLHELRERGYGYRIYFSFHGSTVIMLLVAGDKDSQSRDIKLALKRLGEVLKDEKF